MDREHPRLAREKRTVEAMVHIACRDRHGTEPGLCVSCEELLRYAFDRLDRCPFQGRKPTCAECPIHCYQPDMRKEIRSVMRYAGPRMLYQYPLLAIGHVIDRWRSASASVRAVERRKRDAED